MKLFMEKFQVMNTCEFLVLCVILIIKARQRTNFIIEAINVCLSTIHLDKKEGSCLTWKNKFSLSPVIFISLKRCSPSKKPKQQNCRLLKLGLSCWNFFLKGTLPLGRFPML